MNRALLRSILPALVAAGGAGFATLHAENIVFRNGQEMPNARIVARGDGFISVQVDQGVIRYPLSAIATIDGQPAEPVAEPAPAVEVTPTPAATPELAAPAAEIFSSVTPAPSVAPITIAPPPVEAPGRWNFDALLLVFLVLAAAWLRGLQAVQADLHARRADPRGWTLAALLLPVLGTVLYFGRRRLDARLAEVRARKTSANAGESLPNPASGSASPSLKAELSRSRFDPADHVAAKAAVRPGLAFLDAERKSVAVPGDGELASGLDNASEVLEEAILEGASDIHIEPTPEDYRVRFRLDGVLHERLRYEPQDGLRVVTALKSLAQIDIAEKRRAQDGKFRVRSGEREVDFRVATANSIHGEKVVVRVLDHRAGVFTLTALGMPEAMLADFQNVIHSRNGIILATGPTGSGKTSTLYAALRQLDAARLNIMTIEDPAEYELEGATQIAVNPRAGITYEAGLRSILRQDPDVIFVGEMRDAEAAGVALRAALTGHLVFSTLHTKDAIGALTRLQDMGIERYQIASALLMVVTQRLVRVLCPHCRQSYPCRGDELEEIGFSFDPGALIYGPVGCEECHGTGFRGRTGLFELFVLDDETRGLIGDGADEAALRAHAAARGFKSFRQDGAEKILMGITTVEEVLSAS